MRHRKGQWPKMGRFGGAIEGVKAGTSRRICTVSLTRRSTRDPVCLGRRARLVSQPLLKIAQLGFERFDPLQAVLVEFATALHDIDRACHW